MADFDEHLARIEKARTQIERDYRKASSKVEELKTKMNRFERSISQQEQAQKTTKDLSALDSTIGLLNSLTDSQILRSREAWEEYRRLEHDSEQLVQRPVQLDNLRVICKKMGELAADLLCYSLARFESSKR